VKWRRQVAPSSSSRPLDKCVVSLVALDWPRLTVFLLYHKLFWLGPDCSKPRTISHVAVQKCVPKPILQYICNSSIGRRIGFIRFIRTLHFGLWTFRCSALFRGVFLEEKGGGITTMPESVQECGGLVLCQWRSPSINRINETIGIYYVPVGRTTT